VQLCYTIIIYGSEKNNDLLPALQARPREVIWPSSETHIYNDALVLLTWSLNNFMHIQCIYICWRIRLFASLEYLGVRQSTYLCHICQCVMLANVRANWCATRLYVADGQWCFAWAETMTLHAYVTSVCQKTSGQRGCTWQTGAGVLCMSRDKCLVTDGCRGVMHVQR